MALTDLTPTANRAAEILAYENLDEVLGKSPDAPNERREVYTVRMLQAGQPTIRLYFVPKHGGHPVPEVVSEDRPNCSCMNFQVQGLELDGKWTRHVCKHIIAKMKVMLASPNVSAADKAPWVALLAEILPRINVSATVHAELQALLHKNLPVSTF